MNQNETVTDDISFVEMAKTIVIRKWWFLAIFILVFLAAVGIAYKQKKSQPIQMVRYSSFYSVGYMAPAYTFEPLGAIEVEIREIHAQKKNPNIPVEVEHEILRMGNLIKIHTVIPNSENTEKYAKEIQEFHASILEPVLKRHETLFNTIRENNTGKGNGSNFVTTPSSILSLAQKTDYSQSTSKFTPGKTIMVGTLLAIVFGLFGVFLLEFILVVKKSIRSTN